MSHFHLKWKPLHIYSVLSTEVLYCMLMTLKVQLLSYSGSSCNIVPAGLPTASPGMLHTIKVYLLTSKCILCSVLILFKLVLQSFWITGDTVSQWGDLKVTAKVTTHFNIINWTFWLQPQQHSHKSYCYTELKEPECLCYMQTNIMMCRLKTKNSFKQPHCRR